VEQWILFVDQQLILEIMQLNLKLQKHRKIASNWKTSFAKMPSIATKADKVSITTAHIFYAKFT